MATGVISAAALLATAAEPSIQYKTLDLQFDLGMLATFDGQPIDTAQLERDPETLLQRLATERTQLLIKHIFELPVTMEDTGPVAMLPPRTTKLPNARPPPKPKPLTRWQKFALEKGIKKTKRSQKVWDETAGDWKARHGYNVSAHA
jgi:regulator of ribosome biosynthesis